MRDQTTTKSAQAPGNDQPNIRIDTDRVLPPKKPEFIGWRFAVYAIPACLGIAAVCTLRGCDLVDTTILTRTASPDSVIEAVLLTKDAGATTPTAYLIAVVPRGDEPGDGDIVFVADQIDAPESIATRWRGRQLQISYPSTARIFKKQSTVRVKGEWITILYSNSESFSSL